MSSCSKPRVIAAEIKKELNNKDVIPENGWHKPHIAGELALVGGTTSEPHWVEVRDGQLVVFPGASPASCPVWRLPLRHLNLQPAPSGRPRGFSLTRHGELSPIATFQVDTERDYSRWVKTLAAELLKQTPLEAVKYLDILGITATIPSAPLDRSLSPEYYSEPESRSWDMGCSSLPRGRVTPEPGIGDCRNRKSSFSQTVPRSWFHKTVDITQPLSLIITEEPKPECRRVSCKKSLSFDSSPEDCVDGRLRVMDSICQLAKQSKSCFRSCSSSPKSSDSEHKFPPSPVADDVFGRTRVKSLLKTFLPQKTVKEVTDMSPTHPLDMKDDGRTGRPPLPDVIKDLPPFDRRSRTRTRSATSLRLRGKSVDVLPSAADREVAALIARCQQEDRYVSVRDKRMLFESLGRTASQPRVVLSSDNLADLGDLPRVYPPRTQSLHDLSGNNVAVKEICRYFEQRSGSRGELATRSPSPECRLRIHPPCKSTSKRRQLVRAEQRLVRLRQNIRECEETIWRLQDQSDKLSQHRRGSGSRIQVAVECRLDEERDRLKRLQDEQLKVQQEVDASPDHFGISAAKIRHHSNVR